MPSFTIAIMRDILLCKFVVVVAVDVVVVVAKFQFWVHCGEEDSASSVVQSDSYVAFCLSLTLWFFVEQIKSFKAKLLRAQEQQVTSVFISSSGSKAAPFWHFHHKSRFHVSPTSCDMNESFCRTQCGPFFVFVVERASRQTHVTELQQTTLG